MGFGLGWAYGSEHNAPGPYGYGGHLSAGQTLTAEATSLPSWAILQRPSGATVSYAYDSGQYVPQTATLLGLLTTFTDGGSDYWREELPDGMLNVYPYYTDGRIASLTYAEDPCGSRVSYSYDGSGFLSTIEEPAGRLVTLSYDGNGLLESVEDWAARRTTFAYDNASVPGSPLLTTLTRPSGCQTVFGYTTSYTGDPLLDSYTDPNGYQTTYAYYADGRCSQRTVAGPATSCYTYSDFPTTCVATDPLGITATVTYYATADPYEAATPDGLVTTWIRNEAGLEVLRIDPTGARTSTTRTPFLTSYYSSEVYWPYLPMTSMDPLGQVTTFDYDIYGNRTKTIRPDGTIVTQLYAYAGSSFDTTGEKRRLQVSIDPLGRRMTYSYNSLGYMTASENALGARTTYGYDSLGNQVTVTDPLGHVTTRTFDTAGRVTAVENALGYVWTTTYDAMGRPLTSTDPLGYVTTRAYDSGGRLTIAMDALGNRTTYSYNAYDEVTSVENALGQRSTTTYDIAGRQLASGDPLGHLTTSLYDPAGRPVGMENALGAIATTVYELGRPVASIDPLGHRTTQIFNIAGQPVASLAPLGYYTTTSYDVDGRPQNVTNALGQVSTTVYDAAGQTIAWIDPLGRRTSFAYDAAGRQISQQDPAGRFTTTSYDLAGRTTAREDARGYRTSFVYDVLNRQVALVDANGAYWTSTYTPRGQMATEVDPLGAIHSYSYDARGSVTARLDARSWPTTYTIDVLGRTTAMAYADGTRTTFEYDAAGRTTLMGDESGLTEYGYDVVNRPIAVEQSWGVILTYSYNLLGQRTGMVDQDGGFTTYGYDSGNRLTTVANPFAETTTWAWDPLGRQQQQFLANGVVSSYSYDAAGRPTDLWYRTSAGVPLAAYTATYDAAGNRTQVDELDGVYQYGYDLSSQLTAEQRTGTYTYVYSYTYDGVGNRLVEEHDDGQRVEYVYNPAQELTESWATRDSGLSPFAAFVTGTYSNNVLAMTLPLPAATTYTLDQAALSLVGASGTWDGSNYWNVSLQTRDGSLDPVGRIATATFATNGADIVRLWPDTELQVVDGAVTPYLAIELEPVGSPPNLLASVGSAVLFEADGDDLVPVSGPTTMAPTFLSARYSGDSLGLVLPLAADHDYTVDSAAINLVGAAGTWDASNNWTVSLTSRSASLGVDTVLATGTFSTSGSGTVNLSPAAEVDSEDTPALAIAFEKVGEPPMLLAADATVSLQSTQRVITSYSYDANGNTLTESSPARAVAYTWNGENRLREVVEDGSSEQYTYAATGLRRTKAASGATTNFVWDGQNLFAELDEALATVAQYTDWPGAWGGLSSARRSSSSEFLTYDMSANTRMLLSAAAGVQEAYAYRAFGPELTGAGGSNPFRFGGMVGYYGDTAERLYVRARYYRKPPSQWFVRDPYRHGRLRPYAYAKQSPVALLDPSGLIPWWLIIIPIIMPINDPAPDPGAHGWFEMRYGKYCGIGNEVRRYPDDERPDEPIDDVDAACRAHDDCFTQAGACGVGYVTGCDPDCNACNDVLVASLSDPHVCDSSDNPDCQRAAKKIAHLFRKGGPHNKTVEQCCMGRYRPGGPGGIPPIVFE